MTATCPLIAAIFLAATSAVSAATGGPLARYTRLLGVELERTTLREVVHTLGPADIRHNGGDAAAGQSSVCYRGADGTILVFGSNSEMGGHQQFVTVLQIVARPDLATYGDEEGYKVPAERKPICSPLRTLSRSIALGGVLRLGTERNKVERLIGRNPSPGRTISVSPSVPVRDDFTTERTLQVTFEHDRVVALRVWQVTSN